MSVSNFPIISNKEEFDAFNKGNIKDIWTEIIIQAPPTVVRSVLLDVKNRASWDPSVTHMEVIKGDIKDLSSKPELKLGFDFKLDGNETKIPFHPRISRNDEECLMWTLKVMGGNFYAMDHVHIFEPMDDGKATRFVNYERFYGFLKFVLDYSTWENCFKASNEALKKIAEEKAKE